MAAIILRFFIQNLIYIKGDISIDTILKIAICEDMDSDAAFLESLITQSGFPVFISRFSSSEAFLSTQPVRRFDLIFFDIYMSGITGMEAAAVIRKQDEDCSIVFTTTSENHMLEAFDVGAQQYLIKPVDSKKLETLLKKRAATLSESKKSCIINVRGEKRSIAFDQIYYIEVFGHNCSIHTKDGIIETGTSMAIDDFTSLLPSPPFLRCHKSYIVNLCYVKDIDRDFLMKNGDTVYIRRSDIKKCTQVLDLWRLHEAGKDIL